MASRIRSLASLVCLASLTAACGSQVSIAPGDPADSTDPPVSPEPKPEPQPTSAIECGAASKDPTRTVLAFADGADLVFVSASGARHVAHHFSAPTEQLGISIEARDGYVAAATSSADGQGNVTSEAVLLTREGAVVWSHIDHASSFYTVHLGDKGALVVTDSYQNSLLRTADGVEHPMDGLAAIGAPDAQGRVPVQQNPSVYAPVVYGFFDPASGLAELQNDNVYPQVTDHGLLYVVNSADGSSPSTFVRETPDSVSPLSLDALPFDTYLASVNTSGEALLRSTTWNEDGSQDDRSFELPFGSTSPVELSAPTAVQGFGTDFYMGVHLDDVGHEFLSARDTAKGGVYRTLDHGKTWTLVGPSFTNITDVHATAKASTFVVTATDEPGYFPMDPWSSGDADLDGPRAFVARPDDGVVRYLPDGVQNSAISDQGSCVAFAIDTSASLMNVASGETIELGSITSYATLVWVP